MASMRGWWLCKPWLGAQTLWLCGSGLQTAPVAPWFGRGKIHPEMREGLPQLPAPSDMAAGGGAGNSWGGLGPELESGPAQAASHPRPGCLQEKPRSQEVMGTAVPSLQPPWYRQGLPSAPGPRQARTHVHMWKQEGPHQASRCAEAACALQAAGRRWGGWAARGGLTAPLLHPGPACPSPRAGLWVETEDGV